MEEVPVMHPDMRRLIEELQETGGSDDWRSKVVQMIGLGEAPGCALDRTYQPPQLLPQIAQAAATLRTFRHAGASDATLGQLRRALWMAVPSAAAAGVVRDVVWLSSVFDDVQIAAILDGSPFVFGITEFESCVFFEGEKIHLWPTVAAAVEMHAGRFGCEPGDVDRSTFARRDSVCRPHRQAPSPFGDRAYERLAWAADPFAEPGGRVMSRSPLEMLALVCAECVSRLAVTYVAHAVCAHGRVYGYCLECREDAARYTQLCRAACEAAAADVSALLGGAVPAKVADLRSDPRAPAVHARLAEALDIGVAPSDLAHQLRWNPTTLAAFVHNPHPARGPAGGGPPAT